MESLVSAPFARAYEGRRVLVTGHTGFKGSWLSFWLKELGAEVWGLALPPEDSPNIYGLLGLDALVHSRLGDIRDAAAVDAAFAAARPEAVFHLAAQPLVLRSYQAPVDTFAVNVVGTAQVLESARHEGSAKALVVVSTDKVYEDPEARRPRAETDALGGHDPYSASKAGTEIVAASYRRSFSLPLASARAGNVVGGGDWAADRLIPDCARAFAAGRKAPVRNPASVRPWQHVLEPLSGYLTLGARLLDGDASAAEAWNFGPAEDGVTVADVAGYAAAAWGAEAAWHAEPADNPHEAAALRLDSTKARTRLGWSPVWDARRAVTAAMEWYKAAAEPGFDARGLTRAQIQAFTSAVPAGRP
ncbi:CDP-glucose 4,6-dehydratase [bacterium]|nr:MAG: CDP-glucose 4,6-dehydratase [bacterium]